MPLYNPPVPGPTGASAGSLFTHFVDAANGTTVETDLYSDTLLGGQLATNGNQIVAVYAGVFAGSATALQQIKCYFGGTQIFASGTLAVVSASSWQLDVTIVRVSTSVVRYSVILTTPALSTAVYETTGELTGLDLTATQVIKCTGQASSTGAASNQTTAKFGIVDFGQNASAGSIGPQGPAGTINAWPSIPLALASQIWFNQSWSQVVPQPATANTQVNAGIAAGPANAGTLTQGDDADGPWRLCSTIATTNNEATMYTATQFERQWGAIAFGAFKTPATITSVGFYAGFTSGALGTAAMPSRECAMFRYQTTADGTAFWRTITNNSGTGTVGTTTVAVTANTVYRWAIRLLPTSVEYYMATGDGALALVDTETTTLPTTSTAMAVLTRVLTLANAISTILWGRHTMIQKA